MQIKTERLQSVGVATDRSRSLGGVGKPVRVLLTVVVGAFAGLFAATMSGLLALWALLIVPAVALVLLYLAWKRPVFGLLMLMAGVPLQELIFARFMTWGIPFGLLAPARFWKEATIIVLLLGVLVKRKQRLDAIERTGLAYLGLLALYLALPVGPAFDLRLLGARQIGSFLVVAFVARHVALNEAEIRRVENAILIVGAGIAALGYWNYFDAEGWASWLLSTRIPDYRVAVSGFRATAPIIWYGEFAGDQVVRAGSLLLSPLTLPYYLAVPVAISLARALRGGANWATLVVGITCSGAILLTFTRSAIWLMPVVGLLAFAATKNRIRLFAAVIIGAVILIPVVSGTSLGGRLSSAFDPEDESRVGHVNRVEASLDRVWEHPLGTGLATSAGTDFSFDAGGRIITENWYLQVGLDLGIPGVVLIVVITGAAIWMLWTRARAGSGRAIIGLSAFVWVSLGALVLQHLSDVTVAWTTWLVVGLALRPATSTSLDDYSPVMGIPARSRMASA